MRRAVAARFGPHVMRIETAAVVACGVVMAGTEMRRIRRCPSPRSCVHWVGLDATRRIEVCRVSPYFVIYLV